MIIRPHRRPLGVVRKYKSTGKDLPASASRAEQAWWTLAGWIADRFGPEGGTPEEIYQQITAPLGLTADATWELLRAAKAGGYLTTGKTDED